MLSNIFNPLSELRTSPPLPLFLNNPPLPLNHYFSPFVSSLFLTRLVTMWWKILSGSFLKRDNRKNGQKSTLRIWNWKCNTSLGLNENKSFLILKQAWKKINIIETILTLKYQATSHNVSTAQPAWLLECELGFYYVRIIHFVLFSHDSLKWRNGSKLRLLFILYFMVKCCLP